MMVEVPGDTFRINITSCLQADRTENLCGHRTLTDGDWCATLHRGPLRIAEIVHQHLVTKPRTQIFSSLSQEDHSHATAIPQEDHDEQRSASENCTGHVSGLLMMEGQSCLCFDGVKTDRHWRSSSSVERKSSYCELCVQIYADPMPACSDARSPVSK